MTPEVAIVGSGTAAADGAASIVLTGDVFLPGGELPVDHAIGALLRGATWTVANVEGPLTDREAPAPKAGPALRMPAAAAGALARAGVG
ncbi:MAG: Bacterial capsule synthesis protein cap, partial [Solirubrobacterales bacterium]|nr:Bacterial capsule synthesis protein cap [Solirubrobacterales bacterium]